MVRARSDVGSSAFSLARTQANQQLSARASSYKMAAAKRLVVAAALVCASMASGVSAASNIDQGFVLDGATTYCQGVQGSGSGGALGITDLPVDSAGKCPVVVKITVAATVKQKDSVAVTWTSKADAGVANNKFPSAVDVTTKIPKAVVSSVMKACKAGTNCQSVVDAVGSGAAADEAGPYDASGSKTMRSYQFSFSDVGDYIIVGKVVLPGDASLNIDATEFIALQKITVVDVNTPITASPSPTPSPAPTPAPSPSAVSGGSSAGSKSSHAGSNATLEASVEMPTSVEGAGTVKPATDDTAASISENSSKESSGSSSIDASTSLAKGIFGSNSVLLGCVLAGCFVAVVMGFAFVMRRRAETKMGSEKGLGTAPDSRSSVGMLDSGEFAAKYVENHSARHQEPPTLTMSASPPPIVFDASVRGSEMNLSSDEYEPRDVSEISSLASEQYSDTMSNFDDSSRATDDHHLGSFDWKDSEYERQTSMVSEAKGRGFSVASSALSDLSEGRTSRMASEVSVDSYAFGPSPRSSQADSYMGGYSESSRQSSRISGMSMYSDV